MTLSPADALRLAQLRERKDAIVSGRAVSKVASGGRSKEFVNPNLDDLNDEIAILEARATGSRRVRGSITFRFR